MNGEPTRRELIFSSIYLQSNQVLDDFFKQVSTRDGTQESSPKDQGRDALAITAIAAGSASTISVGLSGGGRGCNDPVGRQEGKNCGCGFFRLFQMWDVAAFLDPFQLGVRQFLDELSSCDAK